MKLRNNTFWKNLLTTVSLISAIYTCVGYFAFQERKRKLEEMQQAVEQQGDWRIKAWGGCDSMLNHNDSAASATYAKRIREPRLHLNAEDQDAYDNPDFDDLIPGEEYDEEFIDRSKGAPELYNRP